MMHPSFSDKLLKRYSVIKAVYGATKARAWMIERFGKEVYNHLILGGGWKKAPEPEEDREALKRLWIELTTKRAEAESSTDRE